MPLWETQAPSESSYVANKVFLFELSANIFMNGNTWDSVLHQKAHYQLFNLALRIIQQSIETGGQLFIETVQSTINSIIAYRFWVVLGTNDLTDQFLASWLSVTVTGDGENEGQPEKKKRKLLEKLDYEKIVTQFDLCKAFGIYRQCNTFSSISFDQNSIDLNNIVNLLDPTQKFDLNAETYALFGVSDQQRKIGPYLTDGTFNIPTEARSNFRHIKSGFIETANDLLKYYLPNERPTEYQLLMARQSLAHASGFSTANTTIDPTQIEDITQDSSGENINILRNILEECYPQMENTRTKNLEIMTKETTCFNTLINLQAEMTTLFSNETSGIPTAYHAVLNEKKKRMSQLRTVSQTTPNKRDMSAIIASKIFFREYNPDFTNFSSLMLQIVVGATEIYGFVPAQRFFWLHLFCRSHSVLWNSVGAIGLIIAPGPPETGKSDAARKWLECMCSAMQNVEDGQSALVHHAMDPNQDLRCRFKDEMQCNKDLVGTASKTEQTLASNGVLRTSRLVFDKDESKFKKEVTAKAGRGMTVTCTNMLDQVSAALKSRACIIPVPFQPNLEKHEQASTLASISKQSTTAMFRNGFIRFCQSLTCLQSEIWYREAAGMFQIDTRMITVFKSIMNCEKDCGFQLSARRIEDLINLATSLWALDMGHRWEIVGGDVGFDPVKHTAWLICNAYLRMEHVVAAVGITTGSTSIKRQLHDVQLTIRDSIEVIDGSLTIYDKDSDYILLQTTKADLYRTLINTHANLGDGIAKTIFESIENGSTNGKNNIKYVRVDKEERVAILIEYLNTIRTKTDILIIGEIQQIIDEFPSLYHHSLDNQYYVFNPVVRKCFNDDVSGLDAYAPLKSIASLGRTAIKTSKTIFERVSTKYNGKKIPTWVFGSMHVRIPTDADSINPGEETVTDLETGEIFIDQEKNGILAIHKSVFDIKFNTYTENEQFHNLASKCLLVAGGYENKKVVCGIACDQKSPLIVDMTETNELETNIKFRNPCYTNPTAINTLLGSFAYDIDSVFPHNEKFITWDHTSNLENLVRKDVIEKWKDDEGFSDVLDL